MTGRTRIAIGAAAATMLAALCLTPLVTPAGWVVEAALMTGLMAASGVGMRRLSVPRPLVVLTQLVVVVLLLDFSFARDTALLGLVPTSGSVHAIGDLVSGGLTDVSQYSIPAPATPGLTFLLVSAVVLIGLLVDVLAVTYRWAALSGLPLLALFSVGTGLRPGGASWLWFLLAAAGYLVLLLAEGQDRLSRWGQVFRGSPSANAGIAAEPGPLARTGHRIAVLAVIAALIVPALLPGLGKGVLTGIGGGGGSVITAVDPLASLQQNLNQPSARELLTYRTDSSDPNGLYLRIVDLDTFDGTAWKPASHRVQDVPNTLPEPQGLTSGVGRALVHTRVNAAGDFAESWLPMPYPAVQVQVDGDWKYEPDGRTLVGANDQTTRGVQYDVTSYAVGPTADQLRSTGPAPDAITKEYLALPKDLPQLVRTDALNVTRGAATAFDKAVALQNWFADSGQFTYNTQVKSATGSQAIVQFLTDKQGFCVHFAATMAAMARVLGIPARVAIGFTPGTEQSDGSWVVGTKDAHAWPELYFPGIGWLRFEPTPSRGTVPSYTLDTAGSSTAAGSQATLGASAGPTAKSSAAGSCTGRLARLQDCAQASIAAAPGATTSTSGPSDTALAWLAAGCAGVVLLVAPGLWRLRLRERRLRRRPGTAARELTDRQVMAAWREMIDSAWDLGIAPDDAETPRRTAARIAEQGRLAEEPREAAGRLAVATERVLYARPEDDMAALEYEAALRTDVRAVREGLWATAGRGARVRAVVLPASVAQLGWAVRERTAALSRRARRITAPLARLRPGRFGRRD